MKIVIVGAGIVGLNVATKLSEEGHDLFLIDTDSNRLRTADENLDIKTIFGDGSSLDILKQAEAGSADLLIAVTKYDAINILACFLGSKLGAKKRIARIRQSGFFKDPSVVTEYDMGIDLVIYPEEEVAQEILQLLKRPYATEVGLFFDNKAEAIGLHVNENSSLIGKTLGEVLSNTQKNFKIIGLIRGKEGIVIRNWEGTFQSGDKIFLVMSSEDTHEIVSDLGFEVKKLSNVFIYGGTIIGLNLAKSLENSKIQARILEPSRTRSRELAFELKKVLVLHGEGTDSSLLEGEGIENADVFVAVTDDEEANLLSCILAKQMGATKSIALVTKPDYIPLISALDVDSVISRRMLTINRILQFVRRGEVLSVSELSEEKIEAIVYRVTQNSILAAKEISSKNFQEIFPPTAIIGAIQKETTNEVIIPRGSTELAVGDKVMIYSSPEAVKELEKIFV